MPSCWRSPAGRSGRGRDRIRDRQQASPMDGHEDRKGSGLRNHLTCVARGGWFGQPFAEKHWPVERLKRATSCRNSGRHDVGMTERLRRNPHYRRWRQFLIAACSLQYNPCCARHPAARDTAEDCRGPGVSRSPGSRLRSSRPGRPAGRDDLDRPREHRRVLDCNCWETARVLLM